MDVIVQRSYESSPNILNFILIKADKIMYFLAVQTDKVSCRVGNKKEPFSLFNNKDDNNHYQLDKLHKKRNITMQ